MSGEDVCRGPVDDSVGVRILVCVADEVSGRMNGSEVERRFCAVDIDQGFDGSGKQDSWKWSFGVFADVFP